MGEAVMRRTTLAEHYVEKRALMDSIRISISSTAPWGAGPAVIWEIVEVVRDNDGSIEEAASYLEIDPRFVEAAIRYYGSNREEIDDWIARAREPAEREEAKWRAAHEASSA